MYPSDDPPPRGNGRPTLLIYLWLGVLTLFFVTVATIDLANHRSISGDDGWILSASHKLATEGTLGSEMYTGFFHADEQYFIALPGQHVVQALFMRLLGSGISQARWASVISGIVLLWSVCLLAWHWYGTTVAVLTSLLLLFWQPALAGEGSVPLVSLSRSLRYDLPAVAWIWVTLLFLDSWLRRPTAGRALITGVASAGAALTQFFGSVVLIIAPLAALVAGKRRNLSIAHVVSWLLGLLSLVAPYLFYVSLHWQDAVGQTAYLKGERANFGLPALWDNFLREPQRYQHILEQVDIAPGPWILVLGVWPALAYLGIRLWRKDCRGDRVLALTLASTVLFLALGEATKAPIYALPLLPPLCIAFALLIQRQLTRSDGEQRPANRAVRFVVLVLFVLTILHGFHFYYRDWREASTASDYQALGSAIGAAMDDGAPVAGSERWWWPMRDHEYLAVRNLSLQWRIASENGKANASFAALAEQYGIGYIIVDVIVREDLARGSRPLQQQFDAFLEHCANVQERWSDATYGKITLYMVSGACRLPSSR